MRSNWNPVANGVYPWCRTLNRILSAAPVPRFEGADVFIASDSSGGHSSSRYEVMSVLFMDAEASLLWEKCRRDVRRRYLNDGRRMSYKALNDRRRRAALPSFIAAAERIQGLCVTVAVRKGLAIAGIPAAHIPSIPLAGKWNEAQLESMFRLSHLVAFILAGISREGQASIWISDEDDMFGNSQRASDVAGMVSRFSTYYIKHALGELGVGTTQLDEGDRFEEDIAAIPDLIAGAVCEVMNRLAETSGGRTPVGVAVPLDGKLSAKCNTIVEWLYAEPTRLCKSVMYIEGVDGRATYAARLNLL